MYDLDALRQKTDETIAEVLASGSHPKALYIIEYHVVHHDFSKLEKMAVEAYELGYEIGDPEEFEDEKGRTIFLCDILSELPLKADLINAQQEELLSLIEKAGATYDGWGTYFEANEDSEEEKLGLYYGHSEDQGKITPF